MVKINEQYIRDSKGKEVGVFLSVREYRKLLAMAEEMDAIRAYDIAKSSKEKPVSLRQFLHDIESQRK